MKSSEVPESVRQQKYWSKCAASEEKENKELFLTEPRKTEEESGEERNKKKERRKVLSCSLFPLLCHTVRASK